MKLEHYFNPYTRLGYKTHSQYEKDIIYGDIHSKDTLLLLGNSHAMNMVDFIDAVGKRDHFSFRSITNSAYPTIPNLHLESLTISKDASYKSYPNQMNMVYKFLKRAPIIIIISSSELKPLALSKSLIDLDLMISKQQQVILIRSFPILDQDPRHISRGIVKRENIDLNTINIIYPETPLDVLEFIATHPNFHYLDLSESEAFKDVPFYNDTIMYYDKNHLNKYGTLVFEKYSGDKLSILIRELRKKLALIE